MSLEFELFVPEGAREGAPLIVLLHGRGSDRHDLLPLGQRLSSEAIVVTPQAPFPSAPWGYGPGWAWYRYLGEDRPDPETFEESQTRLETFLGSLTSRLPVETGQTFLGGFSQGATMSLAHSLMYPGSVRQVMNFSGFLANHPRVRPSAGSTDGLRVFWGHGTRDPAIPFVMAVAGRRALENYGVDLLARDYEIGHWIEPDEISDARRWLEAGLGSGGAGVEEGR